jgi:hypothetical protein
VTSGESGDPVVWSFSLSALSLSLSLSLSLAVDWRLFMAHEPRVNDLALKIKLAEIVR